MTTTNARMFQRRDTTTDATTADPVFSDGELFYETDTGKFIIGDGSSLYSALTSLDSKKLQTPNQMLSGDVSTSAPSDGDILIYDGVTNNRYENRALTSSDLSDASGLALLGGRATGQALYGGTASGDDLYLYSTTNGTKGSVYFATDGAFDESNSEYGFGIQSGMKAKVHIKTASSGLSALSADYDELFLEGSANVGMAINAGSGSKATIAFGDSADDNIGYIEYSNLNNDLVLSANAGARTLTLTSAGDTEFEGGSGVRTIIDNEGRFLAGGITAIRSNVANKVTTYDHLYAESFGTLGPALSLIGNEAGATGQPRINLGRSGAASIGSNTTVDASDSLGIINFCGADGTDLNSIAASIECTVDGTPGSNDMPGKLSFRTTADGSSTPIDQLVIEQDGGVFVKNVKSGATAGAAGAGTNEFWKTSGHATLPNGVAMLG